MKLSQKPILITGGGGFIGSRLTHTLVGRGENVHILARKNSDLSRLSDVRNKISIHYGDLEDLESLRKVIIEARPGGIFHLAASNIMSGMRAEDNIVIKTNFIGTKNLIDTLNDLDYDFFINSGSFLEYGMKNTPPKETDICNPPELYSLTKLSATLYGQIAARQHKKPIITFRLFTPYGPEVQKGRLTYNVISNALRGETITLTNPLVQRDYIFVDDIVDLFIEAATVAKKYSGEIFNCGTGKATTLEEFARFALDVCKSKSEVKWNALGNVLYDDAVWQADMAKTFGVFHWRPKVDLKHGLEKTAQWFSGLGLS